MDSSNFELKFRTDLFEKYAKCKKYLIPRDVYNSMIEDLKFASTESSSKGRHMYYILEKYEILQCGVTEKLIKKTCFTGGASNILCIY